MEPVPETVAEYRFFADLRDWMRLGLQTRQSQVPDPRQSKKKKSTALLLLTTLGLNYLRIS